MPDDSILTTEAPVEAPPVAAPDVEAPAAPAPAPAATQQDLAQLREDTRAGLSELGQGLVRYLQQQSTEKTETPAVAEDSSDVQSRLLQDPTGFVKEVAQDAINGQQRSPAEAVLLNNDFVANLNQEKASFDGKFGNGAFEELIAPDLAEVVRHMPPELRASQQHFNMVVRGLQGGLDVDALHAKKTTATQKAEERSAPRMIVGAGARPAKDAPLDADAKEYLQRLAAKGINYSEKQLKIDSAAGISEDDFPVEETA